MICSIERTNRTVAGCVWTVAFAWLLVGSGEAEETKSGDKTIIHFAIKYHQDNLTSGWSGETLEDFTITLSPGAKIDVVQHSVASNGNHRDHQVNSASLGSVSWHVIGPRELQQTLIYPQNTRTIDVIAKGPTCKVSMKFALLAGYTEYTFPQISTEKWNLYKKPYTVDSVCSINKS